MWWASPSVRPRTPSSSTKPARLRSLARPVARRGEGSSSRYTASASAVATTTSARTRSPLASRTPVTAPPAVSIPATGTPQWTVAPAAAHRAASASARVPRPPGRYHPPNVSSAYGIATRAAGARRGSAPAYVAYRSSSIRSRGSAKRRLTERSDRPGAIAARSGTRHASRSRSPGPSTVDVRMSRRDAVQTRAARCHMRRHWSALRRPSAASIREANSGPESSRVPSANTCRTTGSSGTGRRSSPSNTWGSVSSPGPVSNRKVPAAVRRSYRPSFPPTTPACSKTVTRCPVAASRAATDSPPTPAPMTTTRLTAPAGPSR